MSLDKFLGEREYHSGVAAMIGPGNRNSVAERIFNKFGEKSLKIIPLFEFSERSVGYTTAKGFLVRTPTRLLFCVTQDINKFKKSFEIKWLIDELEQTEFIIKAISQEEIEISDSKTVGFDTNLYSVGRLIKEINEMVGISKNEPKQNNLDKVYDVFICHASEDKDYVSELADALASANVSVWYDDFELSWGDNLRRSIDNGLLKSNYGIVVLSKNFFEKEWAQKELDALFLKEVKGKKVILPIWHNISLEEVQKRSQMLANKLARDSSKYTIPEIVNNIKEIIKKS